MLGEIVQQLGAIAQAVEFKLIVPAAAALCGVWLQSRLSRRQTFQSKLWELRQASYGDFLSRVRELLNDSQEWLGREEGRTSNTDFDTIEAGLIALGPMSTAGSLMWGKHFLEAARTWKGAWERAQPETKSSRGDLQAFADATAAHFDAMHLAARRDLQTSQF